MQCGAIPANPELLYRIVKIFDAYPAEGTWPIHALRAQTFFGSNIRQFFYEPLGSYNAVLDAAMLAAAERRRFVPEELIDHVSITFSIFEGSYRAPKGKLEMPAPGESPKGNHAVAVAGWDDSGDTIFFRNSWGASWGDRGHGTVSRQYLDRYLLEGWLYRNARFGPTRHNFHQLQETGSDAVWRRAFLEENPRLRWRIRYAGKRYTLVCYESISLSDGCPVSVIELRNRNGYRVGWCEAFHQTADPGTIARTILKELFVWPPYRRRGYGTILDAAATLVAAGWSSEMLQIPLYEADGQAAIRIAGRRFASHRGYDWKWQTDRRPTTVAYAVKKVDRLQASSVLRTFGRGYDAYTSRADPKRAFSVGSSQ
jgi:GNAT superfamily N-acetyltransferase